MSALSFVNVFADDIVRLSAVYSNLCGFREIDAIRSPIARV
ncbi:glyoxalase, partial [Pseudomonas syringae]